MYVTPNFKTKKALKEAVARGEEVLVFEPGLGNPAVSGKGAVEGPHYPKPHTWYAQVEWVNYRVTKVK